MILKPAAMARFCLFSPSLAQPTATARSAITVRNFRVVRVCLISSVLSRFSVVLVLGFSGRKGLSPAFRICGLFRFQKQYKSGSVNFRVPLVPPEDCPSNRAKHQYDNLACRSRSRRGGAVECFASVPKICFLQILRRAWGAERGFEERLGQIRWRCLWDFGPISRPGD